MAITIRSPRFSFVQFDTVEVVSGCGATPLEACLSVLEDRDLAFQWRLITSTIEEADDLCDMDNDLIEVGIAEECGDDFILIFSEKPVRYRANDNTLQYNWGHGVPNFSSVISVGQCFRIKIRVNGTDTFCSNCFRRINDECYTAVLDYGNNEDAFGFDYCGGTLVGTTEDQTCDPTIVQFTNQLTLDIPYTTSLQDQYGPIPTVQVWIYDGFGDLVDMGIRVSFDTFPPTHLLFDFGGLSSGVIKIS